MVLVDSSENILYSMGFDRHILTILHVQPSHNGGCRYSQNTYCAYTLRTRPYTIGFDYTVWSLPYTDLYYTL